MDEYYLSKDDWDTIVEIGVGDFSQDVVMKKIPTAAKTALTKKYGLGSALAPFTSH
jgi:replication factor C subunit 1